MIYNNYLSRADCIDHGLHMTEYDDDDRCDHCNTRDDEDGAETGPVADAIRAMRKTGSGAGPSFDD